MLTLVYTSIWHPSCKQLGGLRSSRAKQIILPEQIYHKCPLFQSKMCPVVFGLKTQQIKVLRNRNPVKNIVCLLLPKYKVEKTDHQAKKFCLSGSNCVIDGTSGGNTSMVTVTDACKRRWLLVTPSMTEHNTFTSCA